jgi:serine/threonine protein kinase
MLKALPYDNKIDVWALGVLLFELLHGDAPYGEKTPMASKMEYIKKNKEFEMDEGLSEGVRELILKILNPSPVERYSMEQIFEHPWMKKHEGAFNIDIDSFVTQNSRDASQKSAKTEGSISSLAGGSQRSIFSTMSSRHIHHHQKAKKVRRKFSSQFKAFEEEGGRKRIAAFEGEGKF